MKIGIRILHHYHSLLFVTIPLLLLISCKQGDGIGFDNLDDGMKVNVVDTLAIEASTFLLDPLPTTGQHVLLVGSINDQDLGKIASRSYFRLSNEQLSLSSLPEGISYDSLSFSLFYNGYSYGDTTQAITLSLHRVSETIEPYEFPIALEDDEYPVFASGGTTLLADRHFDYAARPLGSIRFIPHPNTAGDSVTIRLDDTFGRTLFDMATNNDTRLTVQEEFVDFLKGLALVPADETGAVIGFRDSVLLNIHYSYESQSHGMKENGKITFPIGADAYQFNRIATDRTGTPLAELSYQHDNIPSSLTGNRTFIQGASGIVTRLTFPTSKLFLNDGLIAISKAQLIIETDQSSDHLFIPPSALILMTANRYGTPTSVLQYNGQTQAAYYQSPGGAGGAENGRYVFDMTDYVSTLRLTSSDQTESLLLSLPLDGLMATVNRLNIAATAEKPAIKLHIMYVKI